MWPERGLQEGPRQGAHRQAQVPWRPLPALRLQLAQRRGLLRREPLVRAGGVVAHEEVVGAPGQRVAGQAPELLLGGGAGPRESGGLDLLTVPLRAARVVRLPLPQVHGPQQQDVLLREAPQRLRDGGQRRDGVGPVAALAGPRHGREVGPIQAPLRQLLRGAQAAALADSPASVPEPGRPGPLPGRHPQRAGFRVGHAVAQHPPVGVLKDLPRSPGAPEGSDLVAGPAVEPGAALALARHGGQAGAQKERKKGAGLEKCFCATQAREQKHGANGSRKV